MGEGSSLTQQSLFRMTVTGEELMQRLLTINRNLATEDDAQDLLEYAMLIGLIALICIAAVTTVGMTIFSLFWDRIATTF